MHSEDQLEYLERILNDTELLPGAMMLSQLDGLVAGIVLCPEPISPKEWVPLVLGSGDDLANLDASEAQLILNAVISHFNRVVWNFLEKTTPYTIILENHDLGENLWEFWVDGFFVAVGLRPSAFEAYERVADDHAAEGYTAFKLLKESTAKGRDMPEQELRVLSDNAVELIPHFVVNMYLWLEQNVVPNGPVRYISWDEMMPPLITGTRH